MKIEICMLEFYPLSSYSSYYAVEVVTVSYRTFGQVSVGLKRYRCLFLGCGFEEFFWGRGGLIVVILSHEEREKIRESDGSRRKVVFQPLPGLQEGVNLVDKPEGLPVFQGLLGSELGGTEGKAVWIDVKNESSTYALSSQGSDLLDQVMIGRAFTPFQHHSLVHQLDEFIDQDTEILVLPNISLLYLDGQLSDWEAEELFRETWQKVSGIREKEDLKLLFSLPSGFSGLDFIVEPNVDSRIEVEKTGSGLRYSSGDYEQFAYSDSGFLQTTLSYWQRKNRSTVKATVRQV